MGTDLCLMESCSAGGGNRRQRSFEPQSKTLISFGGRDEGKTSVSSVAGMGSNRHVDGLDEVIVEVSSEIKNREEV